MKKLSLLLISILTIALFNACEDPFEIDVEPGEEQLVVDAFITSQPKDQIIKLSKSVPYFEAPAPPPATGAQVIVVDQNNIVYPFIEDPGVPGNYVWLANSNPLGLPNIGTVGDTLSLFIVYENDTFLSVSPLKRTTAIDSVILFFEEESVFNDEGYYAELKAKDSVGTGDIYWIRTWINDIYLSKAAEINIAYDASFTPGASTDGIPFILPIRRGINPIEDDEDEIRQDPNVYLPKSPYEIGDTIHVEIWSITESALFFLQQVNSEVNNGGLFGTPPANVRSNIVNLNPNSKKEALGQFCISAVSADGVRRKF